MKDGNYLSRTESQHNYKIKTGTIFRGREVPIDIGKSKNNYDKDRRPICFNCNIYRYMAKECQKPKKDKEMRKCYKCDRIGHLAKDCRLGQKIKTRSVQKEFDKEDDNNKEDFVEDSE